MKKILIAFCILITIIATKAFSYNDHGYPYKNSPCIVNGDCPSFDPKGFCKSHCTSYVAWRINEYWDELGCSGIDFGNTFLQPDGKKWGDASRWEDAANRVGIPVTDYPIENEVAWWFKMSSEDEYGHVAYIEKVICGSDGKPAGVVISEYNYSPCSFSAREIMKNDSEYPDAFILVSYYTIEARDMGMCDEEYAYNGNGDGDPGMGGFIVSDASSSGSKPNLFVKELRFKDENIEYYSDEDIEVEVKVKNSGKSVNKDITKIKLKYYRYFGEKENDDAKYIGSDNMKGENLGKGETKGENIEFDAPSTEGKHNVYVIVDTENAVSESNESDNKSGAISCRVHDRPRLKIQSLVLNGGETCFSPGDVVKAEITAKNNGGEPFSDIQVAYYLNNQFLEEDNMRHDNLEHDEEKGEYIYFTVPQTAGSHFISAYIDCYEMVQEEDENDNWLDVEFQVADGIPEDPQIPPDPDQGEITIYGECQYFDVIQTYHDNLVDHLIIFNSELKETVNVIGQVAPENFWDNLPIKNGELCFLNWPLTAIPEFSAYQTKNGKTEWLSSDLCPEFSNNHPDPNHQHFIIRPGIEPAEEEPLCKYFTLKKTGESGSTVSYQIIFSAYVSGSDIHLIGQCAPDAAWVEYPVSNKTVNVSGWPKGEPIHFSVYYYDFQGNKWWLPAEECPECFNGSSDPNDRHFVVYLD